MATPPGDTPPSDHTGFDRPFQPPSGRSGARGHPRAGLFLALAAIVALGIAAVVLVVDSGGGASQRKPPTESGASAGRTPAPSMAVPTGPPTVLPSKLPSALPTRLPPGFPTELPSGFPSDLQSLFAAPDPAP